MKVKFLKNYRYAITPTRFTISIKDDIKDLPTKLAKALIEKDVCKQTRGELFEKNRKRDTENKMLSPQIETKENKSTSKRTSKKSTK